MYTYVYMIKMAKQISISDAAYDFLLKIKGKGSFSEAILGLSGKKKSQIKELRKYFGVWRDYKGAEELEEMIMKERRRNMGRSIEM